MSVLVLSAPVGAGHDAAAAALAADLRAIGADVEVVDGLALLGVERLVVGGYHFQILHAAWSWRLLYRLTRSRILIMLAGSLLSRLASRRLLDRIADANPDVLVSAYPIVSATLAGPCATLVTDFDPHPVWVHADLDANLVVGKPGAAARQIRPPITAVVVDASARSSVRAEFGIHADTRVVLIVGGAWGVGNLRGAARAIAAIPGMHAIVVTGRNQRLQRTMQQDPSLNAVTVLGFTDQMPELMVASDVLVQNAGGLTCLEAFGAGLPVVMFDPLPGHGEDNTRLMHCAGLVSAAKDADSLGAMVASDDFWRTLAPAQVARARALFDRPTAGAAIVGLQAKTVKQPSRVRRLTPVLAVSLVLGLWFLGENPPISYDVDGRRPPVAQMRSARPSEIERSLITTANSARVRAAGQGR
jgi:UDP-N-acetylglucosamine:LPS N-acetylglucosamine transferase